MKATLSTKKRVEVRGKVDGIQSYDVDNKYPQRVLDIISNSVTGSASVNLYSKFIQGNGFKDKGAYKLIVNTKGLRADKMLRKIADNLAALNDYAIHVNYDANGGKVEFTPIPSWFCRFPDPETDKDHAGLIAVHNDWAKEKSKRFRKEEIQYYHPYNPATAVAEAMAEGWETYKGQILWKAYEEKQYQLAPLDPVLEDMQTEGHAKTFKYRNITTNFMASYFLIVDRKENSGIETESEVRTDEGKGRTVVKQREESSQQEQIFIECIQDFQGADDALKIAVIQKTHPDQTFELKKVEIQDVEDLYEFTENSCRDNIIRAAGQPQVLLSVHVSGKLGTSKEIKDATDFYNGITAKERIVIEELFTELFNGWVGTPVTSWEITPITVQAADAIPEKIMSDLTADERRALVNFEPLKIEGAETKKLIETLGVGSIQAVITILTDSTLTVDQKKGTLKVMGFTQEQVDQMLPETNTTV